MVHRPALSDPHVLRGSGLHENWGHPKFLGGMAEKSSQAAAKVTRLGLQELLEGRNVPEHPQGGSTPGCTPVASRQTLFHLLMLGVSSGCSEAAGEGPASWERLLRVPSDSCDSWGWQKNRSERKRNGKESVAIFNHK